MSNVFDLLVLVIRVSVKRLHISSRERLLQRVPTGKILGIVKRGVIIVIRHMDLCDDSVCNGRLLTSGQSGIDFKRSTSCARRIKANDLRAAVDGLSNVSVSIAEMDRNRSTFELILVGLLPVCEPL